MDQRLAVILCELFYGKISFIVLVPGENPPLPRNEIRPNRQQKSKQKM